MTETDAAKALGRTAWEAVHAHGAFSSDFPDDAYFAAVGTELAAALPSPPVTPGRESLVEVIARAMRPSDFWQETAEYPTRSRAEWEAGQAVARMDAEPVADAVIAHFSATPVEGEPQFDGTDDFYARHHDWALRTGHGYGGTAGPVEGEVEWEYEERASLSPGTVSMWWPRGHLAAHHPDGIEYEMRRRMKAVPAGPWVGVQS